MEMVKKRGKGQAATFRRYPAGEKPEYDREYLRQRADSHILNRGNRSIWHPSYSSLPEIEGKLYQYLGDKDGEVENRGSIGNIPKQAIIPAIKSQLNEIDRRIKNFQEKQAADGKEKTVPKKLQVEKFRQEALLDVCGAEVEWLEKKKKELESKRDDKTRSRMLKYGPICSQSGSPAKEIDGQKVSLIDISGNTVPIIDDSRSPYDGMKLSDYRKMASDWMQQRKKRRAKLVAQRDEEILTFGKSDISIPMAQRTVSRENLPAWPDGAKNFKK